MKNNMVMTVVIAIVVAAAAFFVGMKYQASKVMTTQATGQFGQNARFGQGSGRQRGGRGGFGGAAVGEVTALDANSITLKLQDGSSKIVNLSSSTTYSKTDTAAKSDIKVGDRIAAIGSAASDGSISAQNVQLNPMFRGPRLSGTPAPQQ